MDIRQYDHSRDLSAVQRIWRECGWVEDKEDEAVMSIFFAKGQSLVATLNDQPECVVHHTPGKIRYLGEDLDLGAVTAVTTSHVARRQGMAKQLTGRLLALQANQGMSVSALGMFDQGFYNQLGFGTGGYEHLIKFDPANLTLEHPFRVPERLGESDFEAMHQAMVSRWPVHGGVTLLPPEILHSELSWTKNAFGLGYRDGPKGAVSHFIWGERKGENGPDRITFTAYRNEGELLELLALIRSLGDQVHAIEMIEFPQIQLQDLLKQPFKTRRITRRGPFEQGMAGLAYWQIRMLDLEACLATCPATLH